MPRRDGTGPMGAGAMTGRGMGVCTGVNDPMFGAGLGMGRGCRRGFGRGLGRGYGFGQAIGGRVAFTDVASKTQKEWLKEQKDILKSRVDALDKQLEELE